MKIAILAPFEEPVPPVKYGGTELVVYNVVEELVKLGHQVTLLASGDSKTSAKLESIFDKSLRTNPAVLTDNKLRDALKFVGVGRVVDYLKKNKFDVVHNNIGWRFLPFQKVIDCPVVTTLHGALDLSYLIPVYRDYQDSNYISISLSQRRPLPNLNYIANVYNGIDISKFRFFPEPKDYFAFLGRMSPEKGPIQAIQIAKGAGVKLIMAAKIDTVDKEYFEKEVEPLIDGDQIKFIGEVDHAGKLELLGNAKALIAPIQWEEPFGLFFVEAMACGTPVIAMKRGSVPEVIKDQETGFICENNQQAVEAVGNIGKIDRKKCFDHVDQNFSSIKMAKGYIHAYQKAIDTQSHQIGG